jgi:hypothetical protein
VLRKARPYPDIEVLGVLPDNHEVDVLRPFAGEGSLDSLQELDGTQVHVLVEVEPERKEDPLLKDAPLHPVVPDGAEVNCPELLEFPEVVLGEEPAVRKVAVGPDVEVRPFDIEVILLSCRFEDLLSFVYDLRADPVAAD